MGNNGKFLNCADVHHFSFSHTANCLEGEYKTSSPSTKLADNSYLSHLAIGNNILVLWSCTERLHIKVLNTASAHRRPSLQRSAIVDCSNILLQWRRAFCTSVVNHLIFLKLMLLKSSWLYSSPAFKRLLDFLTVACFWCELMSAIPKGARQSHLLY